MIQTAEGALNETHDILQRMRELATQAANDTNVGVDRNEIQKEINQLSSEINRIGNTTEFNTQGLLKGDGKTSLQSTGIITDGVQKLASGSDQTTTEVKRTDTAGALDAAGTISYTLGGVTLTATMVDDASLTNSVALDSDSITGSSATIKIDAGGSQTQGVSATELAKAFQSMIDNNDNLKGDFKVSASGNNVVFEAIKGGEFEGAKGTISAAAGTLAADMSNVGGSTNVGATNVAAASTKNFDLQTIDTDAEIESLVGKGLTINGQQVEFYNANDGAYTGDAIGVNISDALAAGAGVKDEALAKTIADQLGSKLDGVKVTVGTTTNTIDITAKVAGKAGDNIEIKDGGVQEDFQATFQVGANKGQSMTIDIADMRSEALGITAKAGTAGFTSANSVTDGTNNTEKEAALDVSNHKNASAAIETINKAIETVSAERSKLGAFQNRLDHTINNLSTSSENLTAAESRIRDVDYALAA